MDTRKRISDQVKIVVSMCCSMPVEYVREGDEDLYYCVKCDHETKIRVLLKEEIMQLELEITRLEIKVAEDLQDFIVGLRGSSKGIDDVKVNHTHTHTTKIIVEAVKEKATIDKAVVDLDPEIATKFEILDGQGRSDVIDNISKAIIAGKKKEKVLEEKVAEEKRKKEEGPVA